MSIYVQPRGMAGSMNDQVEIHAGVHEYAGGEWYNSSDTEKKYPYYGDMYDFDTSPNDPLWFSHHANLDRLHYYWMEYIGDSIATGDDPCGEYYGGDTVYPQVSNKYCLPLSVSVSLSLRE